MNTDNIIVNTHSSIKIAGKKTLYFDPWKIDEELHDADFCFITHDHYDHFSPVDIKKILNENTFIVFPETIKKNIIDCQLTDEEHMIALKPQVIKEKHEILIETVLAYNKLKPFHTKKSGYLGYIITMDDVRYYIAGDTELTDEVKNVKCNIAFLPIGGIYTMNANDAAKAVKYIGADIVIPVHFGCIAGTADSSAAEKFKEMVSTNVKVIDKLFG